MAHYRFTVDILPEEDGKGYYASVPALPGCFSQGKTIEETKKNIQAAIKLGGFNSQVQQNGCH